MAKKPKPKPKRDSRPRVPGHVPKRLRPRRVITAAGVADSIARPVEMAPPTELMWDTPTLGSLPAPAISSAESSPAALAPPVPDHPVTHGVARCRWCGGRFYLAHAAPPQWLCLTPACAERQVAASLARTLPDNAKPDGGSPWLFLPLPVNIDLADSPHKRTLLAGAAGSSKSFGARWLAYRECLNRPGLRVILLRTTYDEIYKNHSQYMPAEAVDLQRYGHGYVKFAGGNYKAIYFANGSAFLMGVCANEADIAKHLGADHDLIIVEEAVNFQPRALTELPTRDRASPTARALGATDGKTWMLSNPGGQGMLTLEDFYITKKPDPREYPTYNPDIHGYILATLEDNPYLPEDYAEKNLSGLSAARYRQLRYGDWSVFVGQFFEFDTNAHVRELAL
jgi:hypothetical protein